MEKIKSYFFLKKIKNILFLKSLFFRMLNMRKIYFTAVFFLFGEIVFAYNPPRAGETFQTLVSPTAMTYGLSSAGGALFDATSESIIFNPALISFEQRISFDGAYTALISAQNDNRNDFGSVFLTGIVVPTKYFSFGAHLDGFFIPLDEMRLANSLGAEIAFAKEVSSRLSIGLGLKAKGFWGAGNDWNLAGSLGFLYRRSELAFMKDFRFGMSLTELGKNFSHTNLSGIYDGQKVGTFPMIGTLHAGVAAVLFEANVVKGGVSLELVTPGFQNLLLSFGFHFAIADAFYMRIAENFNVAETIAKHYNFVPAISVGYSFTFNKRKDGKVPSRTWENSEMTINTAWRQWYETAHAVSANVIVKVGMRDTEPPVIELWGGK